MTMAITITARKAKSLLEAGKKVTLFTEDGWVDLEYTESANQDGKKWFWAKAQDNREDGCWERQESWKATLQYLKELGAKFDTACVED